MVMSKVIPPGSYRYGEPQVALVKYSSRGLLGFDRQQLVKRAGEDILRDVDRWNVKEGEELIHLLALGTTEGFGPNRNGDGFRDRICDEYHDTFVKHARWYRNHANTNPANSFGVVKASMFRKPMRRIELIVGLNATKEAAERNGGKIADEELAELDKHGEIAVSMATPVPYDVCFAAGTPVETGRGLCPIEQVLAGDVAKTHTGQWQPVTSTMRRPYVGTVVDVDVCGVLERVTMTATHPVLAVRRESLFACHGSTSGGRRRRHTVRGGDVCATCTRPVPSKREWVDAQSLHVGDFVVYPVSSPGDLSLGLSHAYLLGAYAGDGSRIRQVAGRKKTGPKRLQGVSLTLDNAWPQIIARVRTHAAAVHGREQPAYPSGGGKDSVQVPIYSQPLAVLCVNNVGVGCREKRLSRTIFRLDREHRLAFLGGLMDTDGSVDRGCRYGSGRISTTNRDLADQVQKLFWGLGIPASVQSQVTAVGYAPGRVAYTVAVGAAGVAQLSPYSVKAAGVETPKRSHAQAFLLDGYMHLPVKELHHRHDELDVFNLSVAVDETYVASGFVVHNCSACGNKARTRAEYCRGTDQGGHCKAGGLRDRIGEVVDLDGEAHHLHADNPIVRWKDISKVRRGADKIGFVTARLKAASARGCVGGAELAEALGVSFPLELDLPVPTSTDHAVRQQFKLACRLADLEAQLEGGAMQTGGLQAACDASVSDLDAFLPDFCTKTAAWTRALCDARVMLPLPVFISATSPGMSSEKAAAISRIVQEYLPGTFTDLTQRPDFHELLRTNPYLPGATAPQSLHAAALSKAAAWGVSRAEVRRRATVAVLRGLESEADYVVKTAAQNDPAREYGLQYVLYKLAFLASLPQAEGEDPLTLSLTVIQNGVR